MADPVLLDLYCGAGGAARGYADAGFTVIGVDINPQPRYPYPFIQDNALTFLDWVLAGNSDQSFDAIHASPPCQRYSQMTRRHPGLAETYPDLIPPTRDRLKRIGLPYIIENVKGAPLNDPVVLCGWMFGYQIYRHRLFESNFPLVAPPHRKHVTKASRSNHYTPGEFMSVAGHVSPTWKAREVMGIDWTTRDELAEAIPPYFTRYLGAQLMEYLSLRVAA